MRNDVGGHWGLPFSRHFPLAKFGTICQLFFKLYNTQSYISTNYMEHRTSGYLRSGFRSWLFRPQGEMRGRELLTYHWARACGATKSTLRSYVAPSPDWSGRSHLPRGVVTTKEYSTNRNYQNYTNYQKKTQKPLPSVPSNWQKRDSDWHGIRSHDFLHRTPRWSIEPVVYPHCQSQNACCNYERDDLAPFLHGPDGVRPHPESFLPW